MSFRTGSALWSRAPAFRRDEGSPSPAMRRGPAVALRLSPPLAGGPKVRSAFGERLLDGCAGKPVVGSLVPRPALATPPHIRCADLALPQGEG